MAITIKLPWGASGKGEGTLSGTSFKRVLSRERKRAERSGKSLLLLTIDLKLVVETSHHARVLKLLSEITGHIRETDICGWMEPGQLHAVIFTDIATDLVSKAMEQVGERVRAVLKNNLPPAIYVRLLLSLVKFPDESNTVETDQGFDTHFYPEISGAGLAESMTGGLKRVIDITGSVMAIILFLPFFIVVPVLIKITSPGPVLFRQKRLGQCGRTFTFYKFRSMKVNNDDAIHRKFVRNLIINKSGDEKGKGAEYKIKDDPRVTPIGRFLRRSSIDELPQFFNVLKGDMSLVGPRPPIPYEIEAYDVWHRYRFLAKKPGITGLWQVVGRSRTSFDGMVRLDLRYIRTWSVWLDIKLLLATPLAVMRGKGAY